MAAPRVARMVGTMWRFQVGLMDAKAVHSAVVSKESKASIRVSVRVVCLDDYLEMLPVDQTDQMIDSTAIDQMIVSMDDLSVPWLEAQWDKIMVGGWD